MGADFRMTANCRVRRNEGIFADVRVMAHADAGPQHDLLAKAGANIDECAGHDHAALGDANAVGHIAAGMDERRCGIAGGAQDLPRAPPARQVRIADRERKEELRRRMRTPNLVERSDNAWAFPEIIDKADSLMSAVTHQLADR